MPNDYDRWITALTLAKNQNFKGFRREYIARLAERAFAQPDSRRDRRQDQLHRLGQAGGDDRGSG